MFCDLVKVKFIAGRGGDGAVSFRREKFVPRGGPDGGDGGTGGNVMLFADPNSHTLADFNTNRVFKAEAGEKGGGTQCHGKNGKDLVLKVPPGTIVYDENHEKILADLTEKGQIAVIAKGGRGGFGNAHFKGSIRQTPTFAEIGEPGHERGVWLELKMIAHVGIIGLPNAGKSSFLARVSKARPKIADYPFTTLIPNLGVVSLAEFGGDTGESFVMADIPGLIEGAHTGKGLGHDFLRHISRTKVLFHMIDGTSEKITSVYKTINKELEQYNAELAEKPQIIGINKADLLSEEEQKKIAADFKKILPKNRKIYFLSAATGHGIREVLFALLQMIQKELKKEKANTESDGKKELIIELTPREKWNCTLIGTAPDRITDDEVIFGEEASAKIKGKRQVFEVKGERIEQIVNMTNFDNQEAIHRVYDVIKKMRIQHEIKRIGGQSGDHIKITDKTLRFRIL